MLLLLASITCLAAAEDKPEIEIGHPPEWQEGDDEEVVTTVGAMRMALWYYDMHFVMRDHIQELDDFIEQQIVEKENLIEVVSAQDEQINALEFFQTAFWVGIPTLLVVTVTTLVVALR